MNCCAVSWVPSSNTNLNLSCPVSTASNLHLVHNLHLRGMLAKATSMQQDSLPPRNTNATSVSPFLPPASTQGVSTYQRKDDMVSNNANRIMDDEAVPAAQMSHSEGKCSGVKLTQLEELQALGIGALMAVAALTLLYSAGLL